MIACGIASHIQQLQAIAIHLCNKTTTQQPTRSSFKSEVGSPFNICHISLKLADKISQRANLGGVCLGVEWKRRRSQT